MENAVLVLSLLAAVAAEAPYHLPRPGPQAPAFNYRPSAPLPSSFYSQNQAQSQIQYQQGYNYPAPIQPQPQPIPIIPPQTIYGNPQFQPQYPAPQPQYPAPQPQYPAPQPRYPSLQPQYPAPQPQYPAPQPQPNYGTPISYNQAPQPLPAPAPIQYQQQGYYYQQPASLLQQANFPLQSQQGISSSALSSYQADSNQYTSSGLPHQALDDAVVSRIQSVIKDHEHSSARDAGLLSLVSGVSLENAKPSLEILSFEQRSPLTTSLSSADSSSLLGPSSQYSKSTDTGSSLGFLPQTNLATSYGVPN